MSELPARLFLLGTIHRDPEGAAKLQRTLDAVRPDVITVEISPYAISFRQQHGPRLLDLLARLVAGLAAELGTNVDALDAHPAVVLLRATLALPYEHTASQAWAEAHDARCLAIDDSERSRRRLGLLEEECLTHANLRTLVTDPEASSVAERVIEQELLARRYLRDAHLFQYHFPASEQAEVAACDRKMAEQIRALLAESASTRVAHVCGWEHLVVCEHMETIARILGDLEPVRELIH